MEKYSKEKHHNLTQHGEFFKEKHDDKFDVGADCFFFSFEKLANIQKYSSQTVPKLIKQFLIRSFSLKSDLVSGWE